MVFYYGDSSNQDSTSLTLFDIPIYVGDTDSTTEQNAACSKDDFEPYYSKMKSISSLYFKK